MASITNNTPPHQPFTAQNQDPSPPPPPPTYTLNLYRRLPFGRKHLFAHSDPTQPAQYFIVNPTPQKHHNTWRPIFYRGDNPKYASGPDSPNNTYSYTSSPIARALRTSLWNSFQIQIGDGVNEVLENKARVKKRRRYERRQKVRRFFRRGEKPPKEPLEEVQEVEGLVMVFKMRREGFLGRTVKWGLGGKEYKWKGTRSLKKGKGFGGRVKGWSHDLKLVDGDAKVVATFEKDRWASYKRSERTGGPPNRKRQYLGKLRRYKGADTLSTEAVLESIRSPPFPLDGEKFAEKFTKDLKLEGSHSGELTEEVIAFTCWIVVEAEHRLRYKILDLIEEIAEEFKE